jgi:hypothetical protein
MTIQKARVWLVHTSLATTAAIFVFFLIAPTIGYPLTFEQAVRLIEIILPVFLGYLGTATNFIFGGSHGEPKTGTKNLNELLGILVRGPVIIFLLVSSAALIAFGISNGATASQGSGMSLDVLAGVLAAALGLLTISTSVLVTALFPIKHQASPPEEEK